MVAQQPDGGDGTAAPARVVRWVGASKRALQSMPEDTKDAFGFALNELQHGERPQAAKPFGEGLDHRIGKLSFDAEDTNTYRLAYTAVFAEVVYVLEVYVKKSKKGAATPKAD